jgi:flagellar hook protein FlgE
MFQALYNSLSGLFSFSRNLETVSNNVSNMNTPGFRASDSFYENVFGGRGTRIAGEGLRTSQGDIRQTGNATDLAIDGSGFFVLRDTDGNLHYTRAGQFRFNDEGILTDTVTGYEVMARDASGTLSPISIANDRNLAAVATSRVDLSGNLSPTATTHSIPNVRVFTPSGATETLTVNFTNNNAVTPNTWLVSVTNAAGQVVGTGTLAFAANGSLQAGSTTVAVTLNHPTGAQNLTLDFGTAGNLSGTTQFAGQATSLGSRTVNGHGVLGLANVSFDPDGTLQLTYSSSESREGQRIALAMIDDEGSLVAEGGRLFSGVDPAQVTLGFADTDSYGRIAGGSLELSNVDLTTEFADMIIIQRGYQASSRVLTVSNEMIENLYNSTRGG